MGAAAFRNKVIADPAVLYMEYAQEAEAAKGSGKRSDPPELSYGAGPVQGLYCHQ